MKISETQRLVITTATLADSNFFYKLMNSANWIKYIGDRGIYSSIIARDYITESLIASYASNGFGLYVVRLKDTKQAIGICGFIKREYLDAPDIGFAFLPEFEGLGFALEASEAVLEYGISILHLDRILAVTTEENSRSRQLLNRLGLIKIDTIHPKKSGNELLLYCNKV